MLRSVYVRSWGKTMPVYVRCPECHVAMIRLVVKWPCGSVTVHLGHCARCKTSRAVRIIEDVPT